MLYPITIVPDRYTGCYSGAEWLAFHLNPCEVTDHPAESEDIECSDFWNSEGNSKRVGRGNTPNEAYEDLVRRIGSNHV